MKRILPFSFAILVISLFAITSGCKKDQPQEHLIDVSFNINSVIQQGDLNSTTNESNIISDLKADYVKVIINYEEYIINVLYIGDMPYTNTINLPAGAYTISEFVVYSDNNNSNSDDDVALAATPHLGGEFAQHVQQPLSYNFTVSGSNKLGLPIEVLRYEAEDYKNFGFTYF